MNKKIWPGFAAVFVVVFLLDWLIHGGFLSSIYKETEHLWRAEEEMKMGVMIIAQLFFAFFFTFIFSKGYEGRGIAEGVRYGLYVSLMMNVPAAYGTYAVMDLPYSLPLQWFIYGTIEFIIAGIALALIFGKKEAAAST
ncbi:MAG: hypothetical protein O7D34_07905 [Ignavibacteria bacterium]|nr:hypothetical protein [Ignavibacteria bacterium]